MKAEELPEDRIARHWSIGPFLLKTAIVTAAACIFFTYAFNYATEFVEERAVQVMDYVRPGAIGAHGRFARFEAVLDHLAHPDIDLPAERKQQIAAKVRVVADRWRPFAKQIFLAVTGEPDTPPSR